MKSKKIKIGGAQINNGFSGQYYLPYSIGLLFAYTLHNSKNKDRFEFSDIIYKRHSLSKSTSILEDCEIILFSTYVWNEQISLAIAKELKRKDPSKYIIFGGPSVPDNVQGNAEEFLRKNPFIDVAIHQEGERSILKLLDEYPKSKLEDTPNISYLNKKGEFKSNSVIPRLKNFDDVPSPYLTGIFDQLIENNKNEKWLASWETNRGCPFSCTYCDWGSATNSKVARMHLDRVFAELEWFAKHKVEFIFCCDANFGMLPRDYEIVLKAVELKKKYGYPHVLSVQNTKNARERAYKVQKLLADSGLSKGVTLAMQSVDLHTLQKIKRDNISIEDYEELQRRFTKDGIPTYTEFILGLPGDTYETFAKGVSDVIESGQHNRIQFNNLSILPNAEMATKENIKRDKIVTVETPIVNVHGSLDETPEDGINEKQKLVISTKSMNLESWKKTRVYATTSEFLYFNKLLQIPLLYLCYEKKIKFKSLFEGFLDKSDNFSILKNITINFNKHAEKIVKGKSEFIFKEGYLDIYWPPGEFEYINLVMKNKIDLFYEQAFDLFLFYTNGEKESSEILKECFNLNRKMMRIFGEDKDETFNLKYNILDYYKSILSLEKIELIEDPQKILIIKSDLKFDSPQKWMREIIWYGHRSGKYLCKVKNIYDKNEVEKNKSNIVGPYII
tara:strand:+ start:1799 stop:3817 length:2019 start_codon:yes stop_codon:yes gene_type:complete